MIYMLMICYDPTQESDGTFRQPEHAALEQEMREAGKFEGGAGLYLVDDATIVRHEGDEAIVTDGPFVETKEAVGGYFMVNCETKEEAVAYAKRISVDSRSWVQIRPVALHHPK